MKKISTALLLVFLSAVTAFGADDTMAKIQQVNKTVQTNVQTGIGGWGVTLMGLLPLGAFVVVALITLAVQIRASKQSQDNDALKIVAWTFGLGFLAAIFGWGIDALIGSFALGNASCGTEVFVNYWRVAMGLLQPGQERYTCM